MDFFDWILMSTVFLSLLWLVGSNIITDEYKTDENFRKWINKFRTFKDIFVDLDEDEKIKLKKN